MPYTFVALSIAATVSTETCNTLFYIIKPMLAPALLLFLFCSKAALQGRALIATGLLFSWAGDVLLMLESKGALFFVMGLVCFLVTHICYIAYFTRIKSAQPSLIKRQPWLAVLVAGYGAALVVLLWPGLKEMKLPVALYATIICSMAISSLHIFYKVNKPANALFVAGALFFAASDSLLAVNKFYQPVASAGAWVIATYCAAQFFIVKGAIKNSA